MSGPIKRLGVVGAGTMGAGIAQLGVSAGIDTVLHDPIPEALERGAAQIAADLDKGAARGRWSAGEADAARARLVTGEALEDLRDCDLVIEAAPELPDLKLDLFSRLSEICPDAVLATNTSSIPVSSIAAAAAKPENVVGMHFFNPPPLMKLLEVIAADQTGERALAVAHDIGKAMRKHVIVAQDGPGFLVNRCGRPFYTEALKLLQERVADAAQIDRICRLAGGFRMGPFELMDLVGIDVGLAVAESFMELSYGEPRWRPSPIQARMVAAGRLGRKSGGGYYDYSVEPYRPEDPERPEIAPDPLPAPDGLVDCAARSLAAQRPDGVGFVRLLDAPLVELTRGAASSDTDADAAEAHFHSLGLLTEWVQDAPGLVIGRIVSQLVNEAHFALGEGVGSEADIDAALEVGLNHPQGPLTWGETIGLPAVLATIDGLWEERREERYRAAPLLRRRVAGL